MLLYSVFAVVQSKFESVMEFPITSCCELWVRSVLPSHCSKVLATAVENAAQQNVTGCNGL